MPCRRVTISASQRGEARIRFQALRKPQLLVLGPKAVDLERVPACLWLTQRGCVQISPCTLRSASGTRRADEH